MNYNNFLSELFKNFPQLNKDMEENSHLSDLPHCVCDMIFVPFIVRECLAGEVYNLEKVGVFFERMATSEDEIVKELLNVSVLEPLVLENGVLEILQDYLREKTNRELQYWRDRYNGEEGEENDTKR